ncbi:beta-glucan synthesis-associated [Cristinia sonorae]|uniref:Beta-glucan synthesis-associated n=1 Tax=Cristinia sonorae TaxID=1940300 RepID=A0A8K0ULG5_9AGAR|nr:beta-glucan synthesis-associated [Cristinia sonorae]
MSSPWPTQPPAAEDFDEPDSTPSSSEHPPPSPRTPQTSSIDSPLLPLHDPRDSRSSPQQSKATPRSTSGNFVSSPLNPNAQPPSPHGFPVVRSRPASRGSTYFNRIASEESQALGSQFASLNGSTRGSMILYRLASEGSPDEALLPPKTLANRDSVASSSGDSIFSLSLDSKYPSGAVTGQRGFVPYAYDPDLDVHNGPEDDDYLYTEEFADSQSYLSWRGFLNIGLLLLLIGALLALFVLYPVLNFYQTNARNLAIDGNIRINSTGQAPVLPELPQLIDLDTPDEVKTRTGLDGHDYQLVFSDEFNKDGRTFYPGDDPFWEAVDLWYGATEDLEWYDPSQVVTKDGNLQITMDKVTDITTNHLLQYKSGMLQSWNKFCFSSGYIEVAVSLPGPNSNTEGYWPGIWTMGNLGRPGYGATTDGMWPYSYNECDVGTFPNQTFKDQSGPAAALYSDRSRPKYNMELSWLPGQRASSCTCPGEEHPGPSVRKGRGAPEIDIFEAEKNKASGAVGQVVSQSAQFAPFSHDYVFNTDTEDAWKIYDPTITRNNGYRGSPVQQAVSALTVVPDDMFQGSGQVKKVLGFEYFANPKNPDEGFITWVSNGQPSVRMGAAAVGEDKGPDGSQISRRLIPEEPMSIVMNLGISRNWQTIDESTMMFPSIMLVDYVRVYQRTDSVNVGCSPDDYPTADYIANHHDAYTSTLS